MVPMIEPRGGRVEEDVEKFTGASCLEEAASGSWGLGAGNENSPRVPAG